MEITGRLTADAVVRVVAEDKKVVSFSIAINDSYRSKGETKKITTFFECAYWLNTGIAEYLKKGGMVQLYGRVGVNAYIGSDNEVRANLTFNTSEIKLLGGSRTANSNVVSATTDRVGDVNPTVTAKGEDDDLPF
ncbi:single-stranded DNA-binding protein [Pedobacter sp.]|uniref:single-stranded DNA-binding protein n=1 Tax=Pedobacter sp. TaxID=1411316 RepID=UPI003BAA4A38